MTQEYRTILYTSKVAGRPTKSWLEKQITEYKQKGLPNTKMLKLVHMLKSFKNEIQWK